MLLGVLFRHPFLLSAGYILWTVVGESPEFLLLYGTVVGLCLVGGDVTTHKHSLHTKVLSIYQGCFLQFLRKKLKITSHQCLSVIKRSIATEKPLSYYVSQSDNRTYNTAALNTVESILKISEGKQNKMRACKFGRVIRLFWD